MSTTSFNKKPKSTIQQTNPAKITYIFSWVNWMADHAPKYVRDHLTNLLNWLKRTLEKEQKLFSYYSL